MKLTRNDKLRICMEYLSYGYFISVSAYVYAMDENEEIGLLRWTGEDYRKCPEISERTNPDIEGLCVLDCDFTFNQVVDDFNSIPDAKIVEYAGNIVLTDINRKRLKKRPE